MPMLLNLLGFFRNLKPMQWVKIAAVSLAVAGSAYFVISYNSNTAKVRELAAQVELSKQKVAEAEKRALDAAATQKAQYDAIVALDHTNTVIVRETRALAEPFQAGKVEGLLQNETPDLREFNARYNALLGMFDDATSTAGAGGSAAPGFNEPTAD